MPYLNEQQIEKLTSGELVDKKAFLTYGDERSCYYLIKPKSHGLKGVVWLAKNVLGEKIALKIIPSVEYEDKSLLDEMTVVSRLDSTFFASIRSFGDLEIEGMDFGEGFEAIAITWIEGKTLGKFFADEVITSSEYVLIAEQIFSALAILRKHNLCHDDFHPENIMIELLEEPLTDEKFWRVKVIDTGSIKSDSAREKLLDALLKEIEILRKGGGDKVRINRLEELYKWKNPDDHLRAVESLLLAANSLGRNYGRLDSKSQRFFWGLSSYFRLFIDVHLERRLDSPRDVVSHLKSLEVSCEVSNIDKELGLVSPFDYISAEMFRNEKTFGELFSKECPWLSECQAVQPIYLYGPRGCGKSSLLRWLSFKTQFAQNRKENKLDSLNEIGVFISCSVELRSRFWLISDEELDQLKTPIIRFFSLLLLEELFDTLTLMLKAQEEDQFNFGLDQSGINKFFDDTFRRCGFHGNEVRLQGQNHFEFLRRVVRKTRWETWEIIQKNAPGKELPDPSLIMDVCRSLEENFKFFSSKHITFLIDDYSKQRIKAPLQRILNKTISFSKQGSPIFKVSSEYSGVDLEGIQEGREVVEVNIGEKYTSRAEAKGGYKFLEDILSLRLKKSGYVGTISKLLGEFSNNGQTMNNALAKKSKDNPFHYHGIDCIHLLCSGDVALALDLTKKIFDEYPVNKETDEKIPSHIQHKVIQRFSSDEVRRIKYIVPYGQELHDIVFWLGVMANAFVMGKKSGKKDRNIPSIRTHIDIKEPTIKELNEKSKKSAEIYEMLTSRAILFSLETSRSRIEGSTERLQVKKILFPAFQAPLTRDTPTKIDSYDSLLSLLTNPEAFIRRELSVSGVDEQQLTLSLDNTQLTPIK